MRTYAEMTTMILQMLQDTVPDTYDSTETGFWIEESLKDIDFNTAFPHYVDVRFKIESRKGNDTAGTPDSLTDATKVQFLSGDAEKVVFNITEKTWAVIETNSSTSVNTLNIDIMNSGDNYEIYNKRCDNEKQIYIGDVTDFLWVESVEYPIGVKRNWKLLKGNSVLEISKDTVLDSDPTLSPLNAVDVLVRFAKPQRLLQATDGVGETTSNGVKGDTTIAVDGLETTGTYERGDEFHMQHHGALYTLTADVTLTAGAGTLAFTPPFEAAVTDNDDITLIISTLLPHQEVIFAKFVAAKTVLSDSIVYINKTNGDAWQQYQSWANGELAQVLDAISRGKPKSKRTYSRV